MTTSLPPRPQDPYRLRQGVLGPLGVVQRHVQGHGVEALGPEGQLLHVGVAHLAMPQAVAEEVGPRHLQHVQGAIDPNAAPQAVAEQPKDMAGAGADVEQVPDRLSGKGRAEGGVDLGLVDVQGADLGPVCGIAAEVGRRLDLVGLLDRLQPLQIQRVRRVLGRDEIDDQPRQLAARRRPGGRLGQAVVGPVALLVPLQEPGLHQQLQVTGHPRLALAEDLDQLAHRQVAVRAEAEDPESGPLGGGAQPLKQMFHREFGEKSLYKDILI